jgi:5'-3' exonuclease
MLIKKYNDKVNIDTYVFLCFFVGNDFLPMLSYLSVKDIHSLIDIFTQVCEGEQMILRDHNKRATVNALSATENVNFREAHEQYYRINTKQYKTKEEKLENYGVCNRNQSLESMFETNWRRSYYIDLLGMIPTGDNMISDICESYIKGLTWITDYYFNQSERFTWFYPYPYSPTILDLSNVFETMEDIHDVYPPAPLVSIQPELQLLMILPKDSRELLPMHLTSLHDHAGLRYMFPETFQIETYLKKKLHECVPILPKLDISVFKRAYKLVT